jgi:hypothetical protein
MSTRLEALTEELFDDIHISPRGRSGRDPEAGEIPEVPAHEPSRAAQKQTKRRQRNGSFDDDAGLAMRGA